MTDGSLATGMTETERAHVTDLLGRTRDDLLAAVEPLTADQWAFRSGPDRWSVGLIVEHLGLVETRLFGQVERALTIPANPEWETATSGKTTVIETMLGNREVPRDAPEPVIPTGAVDREAAIGLFRNRRTHTMAFAETTQQPLKMHTLDHHRPVYGTLNAYQWLLYIPLHQQRHLDQIAEVVSAPGFPSSGQD
jgi:hypothetical protein